MTHARRCPHCGKPLCVPAPPREQVKLSRLVNRLRAAEGALVSKAELADAVWGDDADGGPLEADAALRVLVHKARRLGYPIANEIGRGYRFVPRSWELFNATESAVAQFAA